MFGFKVDVVVGVGVVSGLSAFARPELSEFCVMCNLINPKPLNPKP